MITTYMYASAQQLIEGCFAVGVWARCAVIGKRYDNLRCP
jgi:hypothetical protein